MKKLALFIGFIALFLTGCSAKNQESTKKNDGKIDIVTTFYPMYDFTQNVVGDEGDVTLLIGAGIEPHDYEPSAKDIAKINDADAFVYNNENMETWVPKLEKSLKKEDVKVIKASENILLLPGGEEEDDEDHDSKAHSHALDPHVWLDPVLAIKEVENIRDQLSKAYPKKKAIFTENADQYIAKLKALDTEYRDSLTSAKQKNFVTQHAAFHYLALEYGLNQVAISGLSPDQEPSSARLAELKGYIQENNIKYIYFEENASDKIAKTLADEANVELDVLNPLEGLTKAEQKAGENYISVMQSNLKALEKTTNQTDGKADIKPEHEEEKTVYDGYFKDSQVKDRKLTDYKGTWQSVYPYLQDGTLDQVFDYKAKLKKKMTVEEYKAYYTTGYKTDVDDIKITNKTIDFIIDGKNHKATYKYVGKKILDYEAGNRGVRYLFEATEDVDGAYKYVQFSDHNIAPTKAEHFHIYFGNDSQEALLSELTNWPTYYPSDLSGKEIAQEMLEH
ncbi:MAG: ZinT/AdcA family metal-binding protein [Streptococcaceae bacterium]|jgi:zinc transport system substrate-binding protein|nr:ZinT/AdcA family metal-binding protein [Streptococcaceae bacterium]